MLKHIVLLAATAAVIAGCSGNNGGAHTGPDVGFDAADSGNDTRPSRDVFTPDTGADSGFNNDTDDVSADVSTDAAWQDASADTPDADTFSDADSSETSDALTDTEVSEDATTDITDIADTEPTRSRLEISHLGDDFYIFADVEEGPVTLGQWSYCAFGPMTIESFEIRWEGAFEWDLPVTFSSEFFETSIAINRSEDTFELISSDEVVIEMEDGDCFEVSMHVEGSDAARDHDNWIQPRATEVYTTERVDVIHNVGDTTDRYWETPGTYTVFREISEIIVDSEDWWPGDERIHTYDDIFVRTGTFTARTQGNSSGEICNMSFRLAVEPSHMSVPMSFTIDWRDELNGVYTDLGFYGLTDSYTNGDTLNWDAGGPVTGPCETLSWGAEMRFGFEMPFVPRGLERVEVEVISINDGLEEVTTTILLEGPYHERDPVDELPLAWSDVHFIEPVPLPPALLFDWGRSPYGVHQEEWYIWQNGDDTIFEDCNYSSYEWEEDPPDDRICPVVELTTQATVSDRRWPIELENLQIEVENTSEEDIQFVMRYGRSHGTLSLHGEGATVTAAADSTTLLPVIEEQMLLPESNYEFYIVLELVSAVPEEDPRSTIAEKLRFRVASGNARYVETPLPVMVVGHEEPGRGEWGYHELPYAGPWFVFHSPEIWISGSEDGGPPVEVDVDEYEGPPVTLNYQAFQGRYGAMNVCGASFSLGIEKEDVPFEDLTLTIRDTTVGYDDWDPTTGTAHFVFPRESCEFIRKRGRFDLQLRGHGPRLEEHEDELLIDFELIDIMAYPNEMEGPPTPTYVDVDEGRKIPLSDDPLSGQPHVLHR